MRSLKLSEGLGDEQISDLFRLMRRDKHLNDLGYRGRFLWWPKLSLYRLGVFQALLSLCCDDSAYFVG